MQTPRSRRLAAILFTDIVGYTALMQQDEQAAAAVRAHHRETFNRFHEQYHGEIVQYFGDGTLSVFQSGVEAVECAIAIQRELNQGERVPLRIGLHMGDIVFAGTDVYGDGVNLASRIESMGVAGSILLSGKLNDELKNHPHISTVSLGQFSLKNIAQPVEVFAVANEGITVPASTELQGKQEEVTKTIAVLPFVNLSTSEENEYFSDGMTEEIINALAKIKNLKVTSRTSSFFFKNKNIPITQIGKELKVSTILEGSIRLSGNQMRITAQLIDVADDYHFWSETFDRSVDNIFAVQDEISLLIADKLREHLGHLEFEEHLVKAPEIPVNVYQQYLKSRYHLLKMSTADIEKGMSILREIIQEQPNYPYAYLGMHLGYTLLGALGLIPAYEGFTLGKPFLDKAIALDDSLPEVQLHLSWMSLLENWDLKSTYQHLQKAYEIRPTVEYYQSMTSTLLAEGKCTAALNYIETALQLDPFSEINYHLKGFTFYLQEKYESAIECFARNLELKPDSQVSILYWGTSLVLMNRPEDALKFFQNLPDDQAKDITKPGGITLAHAALGNTVQAEAGIKKLEAFLQTDQLEKALSLLILCHITLGNIQTAMQLFEQGITQRLPLMIYLFTDPILKPLRGLPRFQNLMREVLGNSTTTAFSRRKYKNTLFSKAELKHYRQKLNALMADQQPYLDPNLTLRDLADQLSLPPNHLSQLLNEGFDKNFAAFINDYRLEAFKSKAADPSLQHLTILALAYESGFNSKTVFNTFFKKSMGMTPSAYWKAIH